jgi:hypothetical protein
MNNDLCQCGCGLSAPISERTHRKYGWVKGKPKKYILGHNGKSKRINGDGKGYRQVYLPSHPNANKIHCVYEHLLKAEQALGRKFPTGIVIHHKDGDPSNNEPSNFIVCQNHAYHTLLHVRETAFRECGNVHWRKCYFCHQYDALENLKIHKSRGHYHKICNSEAHRKYMQNHRVKGERIW